MIWQPVTHNDHSDVPALYAPLPFELGGPRPGNRVSLLHPAARPAPQCAGRPQGADTMKAQDLLRNSAQHIEDRATARDQQDGERSMSRTVRAFNALTGHDLSERDGWLFMVTLKAARACTSAKGLRDDYEDLAAYAALAGECVS